MIELKVFEEVAQVNQHVLGGGGGGYCYRSNKRETTKQEKDKLNRFKHSWKTTIDCTLKEDQPLRLLLNLLSYHFKVVVRAEILPRDFLQTPGNCYSLYIKAKIQKLKKSPLKKLVNF